MLRIINIYVVTISHTIIVRFSRVINLSRAPVADLPGGLRRRQGRQLAATRQLDPGEIARRAAVHGLAILRRDEQRLSQSLRCSRVAGRQCREQT